VQVTILTLDYKIGLLRIVDFGRQGNKD